MIRLIERLFLGSDSGTAHAPIFRFAGVSFVLSAGLALAGDVAEWLKAAVC